MILDAYNPLTPFWTALTIGVELGLGIVAYIGAIYIVPFLRRRSSLIEFYASQQSCQVLSEEDSQTETNTQVAHKPSLVSPVLYGRDGACLPHALHRDF